MHIIGIKKEENGKNGYKRLKIMIKLKIYSSIMKDNRKRGKYNNKYNQFRFIIY